VIGVVQSLSGVLLSRFLFPRRSLMIPIIQAMTAARIPRRTIRGVYSHLSHGAGKIGADYFLLFEKRVGGYDYD